MSSKTPHDSWQDSLLRFAHDYGWWRVFAIPVLTLITVWVLVDIARPSPQLERAAAGSATSAQGPEGGTSQSASAAHGQPAVAALPPGDPFTERGQGGYHEAGIPGQDVGEGLETTVRYSIEIEDGINTSSYGGDEGFATAVDNTLADPRSWINDKRYKFIHVASGDTPDTRIRLTSLKAAESLCGADMNIDTSCHTRVAGESIIVINEARWVRGALAFNGDIGGYREYLVNHELGHAIGYALHQPCPAQGALAPVMMQQTISLNNSELTQYSTDGVYPDDGFVCRPNPWPYPTPSNMDLYNPTLGEE